MTFAHKLLRLLEKFAVLSDEQYVKVLRTPQMLGLLDRVNKLDEFYMSMPETPVNEIKLRIHNNKNRRKVGKLSEDALAFVEQFGENHLPSIVVGRVENILRTDDSFSEKEADRYSGLMSELNIKEFTDMYKDSAAFDIDKLDDFISYLKLYFEYIAKDDQITDNERTFLDYAIKEMVALMITIAKSVISTTAFDEEVSSNLMRAYKIRRSDDFDFLLGGVATPIAETKSNVEPSEQKVEFPDYSREEATGK